MGAYTALGVILLVPVAILAGLLLEGGAADHDLLIDDQPGLPNTPAPLPMQPLDAQTLSEEPATDADAPRDPPRENVPLGNELGNERWSLEDALTHSSFWLAQAWLSALLPSCLASCGVFPEALRLRETPHSHQGRLKARLSGRERVHASSRVRCSASPPSSFLAFCTVELLFSESSSVQMSFSTVHAIVNAYIFHRTDLMIDVNLEPKQAPSE